VTDLDWPEFVVSEIECMPDLNFKMTSSNSSEQMKSGIEDIGTEVSQTRQHESIQVVVMQTLAVGLIFAFDVNILVASCRLDDAALVPLERQMSTQDYGHLE
jgi:hypothetical protein